MKYMVEVDTKDLQNLYSFVPLRNRRKKELEEVRKIRKDELSKYNPKTFLERLNYSVVKSDLDRSVRTAERLVEINESTFHCYADSLQEFLEDIFKQIESKK